MRCYRGIIGELSSGEFDGLDAARLALEIDTQVSTVGWHSGEVGRTHNAANRAEMIYCVLGDDANYAEVVAV